MSSLEILREDGPILAVNKPAGLISQGAPIGAESLISLVKDYLKEKYNKPGEVYLGIPHRIDRPVSGVVVFSRNSKCAARLAEQFAERQVTKTYLAVLERPPHPAEGELRDWLYRIPDESRVELATEDTPGAKAANLKYQTLQECRGRTLVRIELGTGRMHQIRIQFGSRGWPILGDTAYGAKSQLITRGATESIALHAWQLTILHPIRYEPLTITAPLPSIWKDWGFTTPEATI